MNRKNTFIKLVSLLFFFGTNQSQAKANTCEQLAEKAIYKAVKRDNEFHCSKFAVNPDVPSEADSKTDIESATVVSFHRKVTCANPGLWIRVKVRAKLNGTKCKIIEVKFTSRSNHETR